MSRARVRQLETKAINRCKYRKTARLFLDALRVIALQQLDDSGEDLAPEDNLHQEILLQSNLQQNNLEQESVTKKLDRLENLRVAVDSLRTAYEAKRSEILSKVRDELSVLESEFLPLLNEAADAVTHLEVDIKNGVLAHGATVQNATYKAVYTNGRVLWNTKHLLSYAKTHPEILSFSHVGRPSVSIRKLRNISSHVAERHGTNSRSYEPWLLEEEEMLKQQYADGLSLSELAVFFERGESAIEKRLEKLGLLV